MSTLKKIVSIGTPIIATAVVKPDPWTNPPLYYIEHGDWKNAGIAIVSGMTGIRLQTPGEGQAFLVHGIGGALNPLNLQSAPYPKIALWTSLVTEGISKIGSFVRGIFNELA